MASYKIIVTPDAEDDLVELRNYIAGVLLAYDTATNYIRTIRNEIGSLSEMPKNISR
jgi:toxin ParE1/3/4